MNKFEVPSKINTLFLGFTGIGILSLAIGFVVDPHRAWAGTLSFTFFFISLALAGTFFVALQFISGAKWSVVVRRLPENTAMALPVAGLLLIAVIFGIHSLYEWSHADVVAEDEILQRKAGFLNSTFFIGRLVLYFVVWTVLGFAIRSVSMKQDETKDAKTRGTLVKLSAVYILVFAYTFTFASIDLIMSLEPHWFQTMFPVYSFAGLAYSGLAVIIILLAIVQQNGGLKEMTAEHWHDLGKYQFMFVVFWAYIAFSQHMLTWYANIPEFTYYIEKRIEGVWGIYTIVMWSLHFIVPFLVLLSRDIKRDPAKLSKIAWFILFMGYADVIWMVYGGMHPMIKSWPLSWMEIGIFFGAVGLFGLLVLKGFSKGNQIPAGDPMLEDSLHFHQTH